ncbi:hypothetical protein [Moorena bouillonii]|uniref:Uncharacterized protein n=1 Tax=Moorena bouillonii PNG TaxID=568701 RepID=A0A1U7N788_9CYAN|nr:hypothetical protein [Moorena bouillonii]OLT61817.1 hypothetical protein BJP37_25095 [Moorena bouillonii PNG]
MQPTLQKRSHYKSDLITFNLITFNLITFNQLTFNQLTFNLITPKKIAAEILSTARNFRLCTQFSHLSVRVANRPEPLSRGETPPEI